MLQCKSKRENFDFEHVWRKVIMTVVGILYMIAPICILIILLGLIYLVYGILHGKIKLKNVIRNIVIILIILVVAWQVWLYAYRHTKHTDNLPGLTYLKLEDLEELEGYQRGQLINVWGEPDDTPGVYQDVWKLEGEEYLLVTYGTDGRVKEAVFEIP